MDRQTCTDTAESSPRGSSLSPRQAEFFHPSPHPSDSLSADSSGGLLAEILHHPKGAIQGHGTENADQEIDAGPLRAAADWRGTYSDLDRATARCSAHQTDSMTGNGRPSTLRKPPTTPAAKYPMVSLSLVLVVMG